VIKLRTTTGAELVALTGHMKNACISVQKPELL